MALIQCRECGKEISDQAAVCPSCGAPVSVAPTRVQITRPGARWEGIGFLMIAAGLIWMMTGGSWGAALLTAGFVVFLVGRFK